jgi:hypothetical protein
LSTNYTSIRRLSSSSNDSTISPQDKKDVIKKEVSRLLYVIFIKEVYHPNWLVNPVLIPKKNKDWRMCVDNTDPNKACKKDPFGLLRIDQVVNSMAYCSLLSFLDCYSGYHQILLKEEDQINTSFITLFGIFCYTTVPFSRKESWNIGLSTSTGPYNFRVQEQKF